jgi:hypothetical protein
MPTYPNKLSQFWQELKRRRVVRVIIFYAAAAFVILELVSIIVEPLKLPEWSLPMVIILLCIGFIISIILSWIFDITPKGIKKTKPIEHTKKRKKDYPLSDKLSRFENSIAVLPFQDMSQILKWQAYHDSLNMRDKDLVVSKAYGMNCKSLFAILF